jgi:uncharacterized repeat protein (TIGR02543 family)
VTFASSNITVYAIWIPKTFTVTFLDWEGSILSTQSGIAYGGSATPPADPVRTGFTFSGWDRSFSNVTSNFTVTARYTKDETPPVNPPKPPDPPTDPPLPPAPPDPEVRFTVTFVDFDGSVLSHSTAISYGGAATPPADPVREGYVFAGWDVPFDNVTSNFTVTAMYTLIAPESFTVTFLDYDGSLLSEQVVLRGGNAIAPVDPVREGYIFIGWSGQFTNVQAHLTITALYTPEGDITPDDESQGLVLNLFGWEIPLFLGTVAANHWSLFNLLATVLSVLLALWCAARFIRLRKGGKDKDERGNSQKIASQAQSDGGSKTCTERDSSASTTSALQRHLALITAVVLAVVSLVLFLLTQNITLPMVIFDWLSIAHAMLLIGCIVALVFKARGVRNTDGEVVS